MPQPTPEITIDQQIRSAERELNRRRLIYPTLIAQRKLHREEAAHEEAAMAAIVATLRTIRDGRQTSLF